MKPQAFVAAVVLALPVVVIAGEPGQRAQGRTQAEIRFQAMDTDGDRTITRQEWRGSDQSFRQHDWNGDRVLSGDEVRLGATRDYGEENDYNENSRPEFRNWTERGFTNLDRNGDGRIARREWFYDREGFFRADRNSDGALTREEFLSGDVDSDREDRFEYLDANRNGRIEQSEWHASRDAFTWLDRNRDGVISRTELGGEQTAEEADLFGSLDTNNDRLITPNEWQWSRRSFATQDRNGDGQLTRAELTNAELNAVAGTSGSGPVGTAGRQVLAGRQIVVDSSRGWVDTGIDVQSGDIITINASGSATLSTNSADIADPAGSRTNRRANSAPLPNESAGALIARINYGTPMIAGGRQTITANASGRLFFSVNDDYFDDNRGAYRVAVSVRR